MKVEIYATACSKKLEDNTKFLFQEQFSDQQALDTHCQAPHFVSLLKNLEGVLAEPNITFYSSRNLKAPKQQRHSSECLCFF